MRRALLLLLAVPALFAGPARADTYRGHNVTTPSGLVACYEVAYKPFGINCSAAYLQRPAGIPEGDPYIGLKKHGKARLSARGDYAGYSNAKNHKLQYGDTWKTPGITCHLKETGLTCRNHGHHGFHLAQGDVNLF
jgi:hypothetical protein